MVNPFDKTFFKFLFGFTLILGLSIMVIFFTNQYKQQAATNQETASNVSSDGLKVSNTSGNTTNTTTIGGGVSKCGHSKC